MSAKQVMDELVAAARDASDRYVESIPSDDPDAIVAALGGGFTKTRELTIQGGHGVTVIRGKNGREACIYATRGCVKGPVKVFEARKENV